MTATLSLSDRYLGVKDRIARAAMRAGSRPHDVLLVAVTKYAEPDQIRELIQLGQADFGENRVQHLLQRAAMIEEWLGRHRTLPGVSMAARAGGGESAGSGGGGGGGEVPGGGGAASRRKSSGAPAPVSSARRARLPAAPGPVAAVRWHMIRQLPRNQVKNVLDVSRLIQSVDSLRLAEEIQAAVSKRETPADVLLQVNTSGERGKGGCAVAAALHLAEQIDTMIQVRLRGLMAMAPYSTNPDDSRWTFARTRELFLEIRDAGIAQGDFNILSMGMSSDFEVAIEEGANLVRVGSAIFGESRGGEEPVDDEE